MSVKREAERFNEEPVEQINSLLDASRGDRPRTEGQATGQAQDPAKQAPKLRIVGDARDSRNRRR